MRIVHPSLGKQKPPAIEKRVRNRRLWTKLRSVRTRRTAFDLLVGCPLQILVFGFVTEANAQLIPLADETVVNTYTTGQQTAPAVATDAVGNFIVVWESQPDPSSQSLAVRAQRFSATGASVGEDFQIAASSNQGGLAPDVAMSPDGSFVVTWREYDENSYPRIAARAFDSSGVPRGEPAFVDAEPEVGGFFDYNYYYGGAPAAAAGQQGEFVVVWSGGLRYLSYFGYSRYFSIRGRRLDANGTPAGDEFHAGGSGFYWTARPDIAEQAPGQFVVVWSEASYEYGHDDSGNYIRIRDFDVRGRLLEQDGGLVSETFAVGLDGYRGPSVATDAFGNFVIAWPQFTDDTGYQVLARRFSANGTPTASAFRVDTGATGTTGRPTNAGDLGTRVAMTSDGHFAVVWSEGGTGYKGNSDGDAQGIFGRVYNPDGSPQSPETVVNAYTTGAQQAPSIVFNSDRSLVVTWQSENQDGSDSAIVERRFAPAAACGDATADGQLSASDALFALQAAVGIRVCAACICDVDQSGSVTVLDALVILRIGLGDGSVDLTCPACF